MPKKKAAAKKTKENRKIPKTVDLNIRLIVEKPGTDEDGRWTFYATFPRLGVPDFRIKARDSKEAKWALESYIYNELDFNDEIVADD